MTAYVFAFRHPDDATIFYTDGDVKIIEADYGSGFDCRPRNEDEAEYAREMADSIEEQIKDVPEGEVRKQALAVVAELREMADEVDPKED